MHWKLSDVFEFLKALFFHSGPPSGSATIKTHEIYLSFSLLKHKYEDSIPYLMIQHLAIFINRVDVMHWKLHDVFADFSVLDIITSTLTIKVARC